MSKTVFLIAIFSFFCCSSCNNQTIEKYNQTIVVAHKNLLEINTKFYNSCEKHLGNSNSKKELLKLIDDTLIEITEAKKPVDELIPFKDHNLRATVLEMFENSSDAMNSYKRNIDLLVNKNSEFQAMELLSKDYGNLIELDAHIRELQINYAYYNNRELR